MGSRPPFAGRVVFVWLAVVCAFAGGFVIGSADRRAAILEPEYHRHLMFGAADRRLATRLGRELAYHETQGRLPWPQLQVVRRVERAVADRKGETLAILMARQTGKNEMNAFLEARMLAIFSSVTGSVWIRTAPTYRPQIVNSKLRLEKMLRADPLTAGRVRNREGYIVQHGAAQVQFLSAASSANVIGATASIALSVDEAHKIDRGKFEEDFGPFTASTNAPTILWGVAADKLDLLNEYREKARGTDRLLEFPAEMWCELSPAYRAHYESRVRKLGADHPVILTQYRLIPVEAMGSYLNAAQRASLFSGEHPRLEAPRAGFSYVVVVDIGGESELDVEDRQVREAEPTRDSTMAHIAEIDPAAGDEPYPLARVVASYWWTGRPHMDVLPDLVATCRHWNVVGGAIDARGVGEAVAMAVGREFPSVQPYKASAADVSEDCYDLQARLNVGRVKFWRADPAADPERREMDAQARHTRYEIRAHELMRIVKPGSALHIDGIKALTYLHRALESPYAGAMAFVEGELRRHREGKGRHEEDPEPLRRARS